ncbi:MAG: ABC transporter ATP-binding protein [Bacteroidota bacterium]|nr:ABC transporter ATP-binding protein [Bacteroidota bacterium]
MNKLLEARDLSIGYRSAKGEATVLHKDINIHLNEGELICLLGPNGAGKSTLIKSLSGFLPQINGDVIIDAKSINNITKRELSMLLGVVLTDKIKLSHTTVESLVGMGRYPYTSFWGKLSKNDIAVVDWALDLIGISEMKNRELTQLSDGELQKVLIAKALAQDTRVIILDEPTAFLDFPSKIEIIQILLRLAKETKKAILMSTHDVELAIQAADKIWLMDKGKTFVQGCPEDIVINNQLNNFFEREYIYFNKEVGTFQLKNNYNKRIATCGNNSELLWLNKALNRIGYSIDNSAKKIRVEINSKNVIKIYFNDIFANEFMSIEALLLFLKRNP